MKKKLLFLAALLLSVGASAQEISSGGSNGKRELMFYEAGMSVAPKQHNLTPYTADFTLGFQVTERLSLMATCQGVLALYKDDVTRTYFESNYGLGGGVGFTLFRGKSGASFFNSNCALDLHAKVVASVGNVDWKYTQYDFGLTLYDYHRRGIYIPVTVGFRSIDSRTPGLRNYNNIYLRVAFGF